MTVETEQMVIVWKAKTLIKEPELVMIQMKEQMDPIKNSIYPPATVTIICFHFLSKSQASFTLQ